MAPKASVSKAARAVATASAEPAATEPSGAIVLAIAAPTLADLEQVIASGLRTFIDVGQALTKIRDGELYKETHATFEAYCAERWDMARAHAYRLIEAASVVENVTHGRQGLPAPTVERHVRELARLPPKEQPKAWAQAVKSAPAGGVTAQHVARVVAARMPESAPKAKRVAAAAAVTADAAPVVGVVQAPVVDEPAALADLNGEIERRLMAWTWTAERFASTLETWAQLARAGVAEKAS